MFCLKKAKDISGIFKTEGSFFTNDRNFVLKPQKKRLKHFYFHDDHKNFLLEKSLRCAKKQRKNFLF